MCHEQVEALPPRPRVEEQSWQHPGHAHAHLAFTVLVTALRLVASTSSQARDPDASNFHDPPVNRLAARHLDVIRVMVPGDKYQGDVELCDDVFEVPSRKIATANDQIDIMEPFTN